MLCSVNYILSLNNYNQVKPYDSIGWMNDYLEASYT